MEKHIAQTLSTATNLKSLCIMLNWAGYYDMRCTATGPTAFKEIIGECEFPQLRSLMLHAFISTEAELIGFLHSASHLQHLTLKHHKLRMKDNWESCANRIKIALPALEHIVVDDLGFNYDDHSRIRQTVHCSPTDVQGFFFQGKANPFACTQARDERIQLNFLVS